ncbi:MAG: hypothetical protein KAH03_08445 [Cocleimonas sp.]|nr:hypothetical protein [Cocleimonas sp.]
MADAISGGVAAGGAGAMTAEQDALMTKQNGEQAGMLTYQSEQVSSQAKFLMESAGNKMTASIAQAVATFAGQQAQAAARA